MAQPTDWPQYLGRRGFPVLPIGQSRDPKAALLEEWQHRASTDPTVITEMFRWWPNANPAYSLSGMVAVDIDTIEGHGKDGPATWAALSAGREIPRTWTVRTTTGGTHLVFTLPDGVTVKSETDGLGVGVDIKSGTDAKGAYLVAPGAVIGGKPYVLEDDSAPAPAPGWLLAELADHGLTGASVNGSSPVSTVSAAPVDIVAPVPLFAYDRPVPYGKRDDTAISYAGWLRQRGVPEEVARQAVTTWHAAYVEQPPGKPFTLADALAKVDNAYRRYLAPSQVNAGKIEWTGKELLTETFATPRYAVENLIPQGTTLLVAPPKAGKSFLVLAVAIAVARGEKVLGRVDVDAGDALYLALEDSPRRVAGRLRMLLGDAADDPSAVDRLTVWTADPVFDTAAVGGRIGAWLTGHPSARLVIVDVLARVRAPVNGRDNPYAADYAAVATLKAIADVHNVALVIVHHSRKLDSKDFVDLVSGTNGVAGAADAVLVIKRPRQSANGVLHLTGRDVEEAELAATFADGLWTLTDEPPATKRLSETSAQILSRLGTGPATPAMLATALGLNREAVKKGQEGVSAALRGGTDRPADRRWRLRCPHCPRRGQSRRIDGP